MIIIYKKAINMMIAVDKATLSYFSAYVAKSYSQVYWMKKWDLSSLHLPSLTNVRVPKRDGSWISIVQDYLPKQFVEKKVLTAPWSSFSLQALFLYLSSFLRQASLAGESNGVTPNPFPSSTMFVIVPNGQVSVKIFWLNGIEAHWTVEYPKLARENTP